MKAALTASAIPTVLALSWFCSHVQAQSLTAEDLALRATKRRAVEAVNWGLPAVNYDVMYQAMIRDAKGAPNQVLYWSRLPGWKNQSLTPNPDVIHVMPFFNLKDVGPMVLEIPAALEGAITGTVMDCWQSALEEVGPTGADKGKGGKYLILPPGHKGKVPPGGYIVLSSYTYQGYALLRSIPRTGGEADVANAVSFAKKVKFYPLSQAAGPPATTFVDAANIVFDSTITYDWRFFQSLNRIVQLEPWLPRDKLMVDMLKSVGIEKGKPFNPDLRAQDALNEAAREARAWLDARFETAFPVFYEGTQWASPAVPELKDTASTFYETAKLYSVDARGLAGYYAFAPIKQLGAGQFYVMATRDKQGRALDGGDHYALTVPAQVPVKQFWAATVYDRSTHAFIRNVPRSSRSSRTPELQRNEDGSVTLYFGPVAPPEKESNWIPTIAGRNFEVLFRLSGPEDAFFKKTWVLPDMEGVQ